MKRKMCYHPLTYRDQSLKTVCYNKLNCNLFKKFCSSELKVTIELFENFLFQTFAPVVTLLLLISKAVNSCKSSFLLKENKHNFGVDLCGFSAAISEQVSE